MPSTEVRHGKQLYAEEARIILDVFHHHFCLTQRMRRLQRIARIGHFGDQTFHPVVEFQFQQTAILSGADVFTLNNLQVVRNARQQEDIRQTGVDTAVCRRISGVIQCRFLRGVRGEETGIIAVL